MRGNTFGQLFSVTSFGESHGKALGVVIDGLPAGLEVNELKLQEKLEKRRPGRLKVSSARDEKDHFEILSGVFKGKTLGTPLCVIVANADQRSEDYNQLEKTLRPGHADKTTMLKFGRRDHRGGGRASGRETVARVIAGYFAELILPQVNYETLITQIGPYKFSKQGAGSALGLADLTQDKKIEKYLLELKAQGESAGGSVKIKIENVPAGLGEPVFDKLKADLSKAFLSIGSCMGVNFGAAENFAHLLGSEISHTSSYFGGIEGGISNGDCIYAKLYFKAPSTIGEKAKKGRHDPCILPRVLPVIESMAQITLTDHYLRQNAFQLK